MLAELFWLIHRIKISSLNGFVRAFGWLQGCQRLWLRRVNRAAASAVVSQLNLAGTRAENVVLWFGFVWCPSPREFVDRSFELSSSLHARTHTQVIFIIWEPGWLGRGSISDWGNRFLCPRKRPYSSCYLLGTSGSFLKGRKPAGADVKNEWSYASTSPVCLHGTGTDLTPTHYLWASV